MNKITGLPENPHRHASHKAFEDDKSSSEKIKSSSDIENGINLLKQAIPIAKEAAPSGFWKTKFGNFVGAILVLLIPAYILYYLHNKDNASTDLSACEPYQGEWGMTEDASYKYPINSAYQLIAKAEAASWHAHCEKDKHGRLVLSGIDITSHKVYLNNIDVATSVNANKSTIIFPSDGNPKTRIVSGFYKHAFKVELLSKNINDAISRKKFNANEVQDAISLYRSQIEKQDENPRECIVNVMQISPQPIIESSCGSYVKKLIKLPE